MRLSSRVAKIDALRGLGGARSGRLPPLHRLTEQVVGQSEHLGKPSAPVMSPAATIALTTASSVASTVASKIGVSSSFE